MPVINSGEKGWYNVTNCCRPFETTYSGPWIVDTMRRKIMIYIITRGRVTVGHAKSPVPGSECA
jgi:hypothetical protein